MSDNIRTQTATLYANKRPPTRIVLILLAVDNGNSDVGDSVMMCNVRFVTNIRKPSSFFSPASVTDIDVEPFLFIFVDFFGTNIEHESKGR